MGLKERLELFKNKGWSYDPITGEIFSHTGKLSKTTRNGYIVCSIKKDNTQIRILAHQLGFYLHYDKIPIIIDHINRDGMDNRIINLRSVTHKQNMWNTGAKGYHYSSKLNKYRAKIVVEHKRINLGNFVTESEAREAYLMAKIKYHTIND